MLTMIGMESQKSNAGGEAVAIFESGQVPKSVAQAMDKGSILEGQSVE